MRETRRWRGSLIQRRGVLKHTYTLKRKEENIHRETYYVSNQLILKIVKIVDYI